MNCEICAFDNPKATVSAVIWHRGRILIVKRNIEPFKDKWGLPGGFLQRGETPEQALEREVQEELGCEVWNPYYFGGFPGLYEWKGMVFPIIAFTYECLIRGEVKLSDENSSYQWVVPEEARAIGMCFDCDQLIVEKICNKKS